ncbi:MAG: hypothetical protein ACK55Z_30050, partial [bacterium]
VALPLQGKRRQIVLGVRRQPLRVRQYGYHRGNDRRRGDVEVAVVEIVDRLHRGAAEDHDEDAVNVVACVGHVELRHLFLERSQVDRLLRGSQCLHRADLVRERQVGRRPDDLERRAFQARRYAISVLHHQFGGIPSHVTERHVPRRGLAIDETQE